MSWNRRSWLRAAALAPLAAPGACWADSPIIQTVLGPIQPEALGPTLPHEHVLVDFIGAARATPERYDRAEVQRVVLPHLQRIQAQGVRALVECTPAYLGRDPVLLKALARQSGLHILTNTGLYAANGGRHLPASFRDTPAERLAAGWIAEATQGIGDSGVRPGFIKIGYDAGPLNPDAVRLVEAAAATHLATHLVIAAHSGDGIAALEALDRLEKRGVPPHGFIWVHAQNETDPARQREAASRGAWVELDGVGPGPELLRHLDRVLDLAGTGHLNRLLISHDAGWYRPGEPGGGAFRGYDTVLGAFRQVLLERGLGPAEFDQLTVANPRQAFSCP
jgi:phosphotriesterase-related protein